MRKWNQTTVEWGCNINHSIGTVIRAELPDNKLFSITKLKAVSRQDQKGILDLQFFNINTSGGVPTDGEASLWEYLNQVVTDLLEEREEVFRQLSVSKINSCYYQYDFELRDKEGFCDAALILARAILERLVKSQKSVCNHLSDFVVTQETFVQLQKGGQISFADALRIKHQLPVELNQL